MTAIVKNKTGLTVPATVQRKAGFKVGDVVVFKASGGVITILPKLPSADDEYTPEQRRIIDASLAEGLADLKAGRMYGPFETHKEMMDSLRGQSKKGKKKNIKRALR